MCSTRLPAPPTASLPWAESSEPGSGPELALLAPGGGAATALLPGRATGWVKAPGCSGGGGETGMLAQGTRPISSQQAGGRAGVPPQAVAWLLPTRAFQLGPGSGEQPGVRCRKGHLFSRAISRGCGAGGRSFRGETGASPRGCCLLTHFRGRSTAGSSRLALRWVGVPLGSFLCCTIYKPQKSLSGRVAPSRGYLLGSNSDPGWQRACREPKSLLSVRQQRG